MLRYRKENPMSRKLPEIKKRKDGYYEQKITVSTNVRRSVYGATPTKVRRKTRSLSLKLHDTIFPTSRK